VILSASLVKTSLFLVPTLAVQLNFNGLYLKQESSAECAPQSLIRWAPQTATWVIENGYQHNDFRAFIGHKSYHSIESLKPLDSFDYIGVEYKGEFK
jgi:hypothetical protein